jgi:hypothetical protein
MKSTSKRYLSNSLRLFYDNELKYIISYTTKSYFEPKLFPYHFLFLVHSTHIYLPMKMEQTECSEMSAYILQTPGNYLKESIQRTEHGESLK